MLYGRERECKQVDRLLAGARERCSAALVVRGEAGMGKSALLGYAAERARGLQILRTAGIQTESQLPFAAVLQVWAADTGAPWATALTARCRGLLATDDDQDRHFAEALRVHAPAGRPFDTARTQLLYGESLRRRRRRADARKYLRSAHETFGRLGATPWAEHAGKELLATGEKTRKRDVSTAAQLTPQELQITRFVAEGETNRTIATLMFLSPRTVDYHLRKVFTKLGLSSRAELIRLVMTDPALAGRATTGSG